MISGRLQPWWGIAGAVLACEPQAVPFGLPGTVCVGLSDQDDPCATGTTTRQPTAGADGAAMVDLNIIFEPEEPPLGGGAAPFVGPDPTGTAFPESLTGRVTIQGTSLATVVAPANVSLFFKDPGRFVGETSVSTQRPGTLSVLAEVLDDAGIFNVDVAPPSRPVLNFDDSITPCFRRTVGDAFEAEVRVEGASPATVSWSATEPGVVERTPTNVMDGRARTTIIVTHAANDAPAIIVTATASGINAATVVSACP